MSKELPYFKFYVNEWITGDITLEDYEIQGIFINICAYYWSKECVCTFVQLNKRFRDVSDYQFQILIDNNIMKIVDGNVIINFLDEQNGDRKLKSATNSNNGSKGGRPLKKTENKPNEKRNETETKPKINPIESETESESISEKKQYRREEKREENNIINNENIEIPISEKTIRNQYDNFLLKTSTQKEQMAMGNAMTNRQIDIACIGFVSSLLESGELKMSSIYPNFHKHFRNWFNKFGKENLGTIPKDRIELEFRTFKINEFSEKNKIDV